MKLRKFIDNDVFFPPLIANCRFDERSKQPGRVPLTLKESLRNTMSVVLTARLGLVASFCIFAGLSHGFLVADYDAVSCKNLNESFQ